MTGCYSLGINERLLGSQVVLILTPHALPHAPPVAVCVSREPCITSSG